MLVFPNKKRITIFAGHYGSGKTNIALNYARLLKKDQPLTEVTLADLDIVNPYFRTKDSAKDLAADGIGLVVSEFANSNVDLPAMPKEIYSLVSPTTTSQVVMDIGGDDRGALALGRYIDDIVKCEWEMLAVINASRPLTRTPEDAVEVLREIECACRLPFTGIVNNTNLGKATKAQDIISSIPFAESVSKAMGIPVSFTCCEEKLFPELDHLLGETLPIFPINIQKLYYQLEN